MATNIIITRASLELAEASSHALPSHLYVSLGVGVILAALLFKPFFKDWSGFWECIVFWMKPDWISWWQGTGVEDWWAELKLFAWFAISAGSGLVVFAKLPRAVPGLFGP